MLSLKKESFAILWCYHLVVSFWRAAEYVNKSADDWTATFVVVVVCNSCVTRLAPAQGVKERKWYEKETHNSRHRGCRFYLTRGVGSQNYFNTPLGPTF